MNYTIATGPARDDTWFQLRSTGIGASEIAAVLGESKWGSPLTVYLQKIGESDGQEHTEAMDWGLKLERVICEELATRADVTITARPPGLLRSTEHTWALASPDAMTYDNEPVEVKNLAWGYREDEWEDALPQQYYLQCQQQMLVTGAQRCLFGALTHGQRLVWEWVPRNEIAIQRIIVGGAAFWQRVLDRNPPSSDGHASDRKALANQATEDDAVELYEADIDGLLGSYQQWRTARLEADKEAKALKKAEEAAGNQIAQRLGHHRSGYTVTGWQMAWKRVERKGYVVKPTSYEQFTITPPKEIKVA
jgi:putative phage-type endonuclease